MFSDFLKLNKGDFIRGLIIAVLAPTLTLLASAFNDPSFALDSLDWFGLIKIALASGFSYLIKNLLTDHKGKILGHIG